MLGKKLEPCLTFLFNLVITELLFNVGGIQMLQTSEGPANEASTVEK